MLSCRRRGDPCKRYAAHFDALGWPINTMDLQLGKPIDYGPTPEPDDLGPKEVFAFFGLASYRAQVLEQELVNLSVAVAVNNRGRLVREDMEQAFQAVDAKTFGQLLADIQRQIPIDVETAELLQEAVRERNFLAHRFFKENDAAFLSDKGRAQMIHHLRKMSELFADADGTATPISHALLAKAGVTQDLIDKSIADLLAQAEEIGP